MEAIEKILCRKCGVSKDSEDFYYNKKRGKRISSCKECLKSKYREKYQPKNGRRILSRIALNPFLCPRCKVQKRKKDFYSTKEGKIRYPCKECELTISRENWRLKNPEIKRQYYNEQFRCTKCGELKNPDDFNYHKRGASATYRVMPCKDCLTATNKNYRELKDKYRQLARLKWQKACLTKQDIAKQAESILKAQEHHERIPLNPLLKPLKRNVDYTKFRNLAGKYQICPQCGIERRLSDFTEIKQSLLWCTAFKYIIKYREVYHECSDCRNRMHELFDQFVMHAY